MARSDISPVVVDGLVSGEKLSQLLALEAEYPELDFKRRIDLSSKRDVLELAKDVGAMRVKGGYIVLGVDGRGEQTDGMDDIDMRFFDEANLVPKLLRYLADLDLRVQVFRRGDHPLVLLCVLPSPSGCTFFRADGVHPEGEKVVTVFSEGEVFWRDGTRSVRINSQGFEEIIDARVVRAKDAWLDEQHRVRRRELELDDVGEPPGLPPSGSGGGRLPLDRLNLDLPPDHLNRLVLELARDDDSVGFNFLLNEAPARAQALIENGDVESGLGDLLDRLICIAAVLLAHHQTAWFNDVVQTLVKIYGSAFRDGDVRRFGYSSRIDPQEIAPRAWLAVIEHVFALGALAVRLESWSAVRCLTLQLPQPLVADGYDRNWLRHALTMAARADQLQEEQDDGRRVELSLLSLARNVVSRLGCLRADGISADDEAIFTSLARFDFLSNLIAVDDARELSGRVFYPNFARFRQERIQPIAERIINDQEMRKAVFRGDQKMLAEALLEVGNRAASEGWRFDGFMGWEHSPIAAFIAEHLGPERA